MTLEQCQEIINFYEDNPKLHRKGEVLKEEGFTIDYDKVKRCTEMYISADALSKPNVFENLTEVIVKLNLFEKTVSPPHKKILYLFCSCFKDFEIIFKLDGENDFLLPDPDIK